MKASCYLVVEPERSYSHGPIVSVRVRRMSIGQPSLKAGQTAIRIDLDVPPEAFDARCVGIVVEPCQVALAAEQAEFGNAA